MKRFAIILAATTVLAAPAFAADVITEEPPAPAPVEAAPAYNWTGLYIGGQAGVAFGGSAGALGPDLGFSGIDTFQRSPKAGFTGGLHVGYDYQLPNNVLLGGVADFNYIRSHRTVGYDFGDIDSDGIDDGIGVDVRAKYFGTVRAKLGYAVDRFAVYGTGGFAYGRVKADLDTEDFNAALGRSRGSDFEIDQEKDKEKFGYSVGAGVDYLATQNISFGLEYLYTNLGHTKTSTTFTEVGTGDSLSFDTKTNVDFHTIMAKAAYRFN